MASPGDEGGISGSSARSSSRDDAPNIRSNTCQHAFRRGGFGLTVEAVAEADMERGSQIMEDCSALDVNGREQQWHSDGWTRGTVATSQAHDAVATTDAKAVNLFEENLAVGKRLVDRRGVRVFSRVVKVPT